MHIEKIRIVGYSAFNDTGWFDLSPNVNIVAGKNNSGKSSLLKAAAGLNLNNAHRSPESYLPGALPTPRVEYTFGTSVFEFVEQLKKTTNSVTVQAGGPTVADQNFVRKILEKDKQLKLNCTRTDQNGYTITEPMLPKSPHQNNPYQMQLRYIGGKLEISGEGAGGSDSTMAAFTGPTGKIFYFPAERYHRSRAELVRSEQLNGDASNLAGYLQFLQGNDVARFEEIVARLCQIVPSIEHISIDTLNDGFEVLVWPTGSKRNRDLASPLSHCGSGVSQVLAIFACVATRRDAIVVVDEINSFLHPLAVKDLISTLASEYPSHQYIISSHSSEVLSHASVEKIINVEKHEFESSIKGIDRSDINELQASLRSLGVSMADVLGSDYFIWVEGPTEVIALPALYRKHKGTFPSNVRVAAVDATGDFSKKGSDSRVVVRLYDRVSQVSAPLNLGQAFLLDKEGYREDTVKDILNSTDRKLNFINRRCIENYAIDPKAVSKLISEEIDGDEFSEEVVEAAMHLAASDEDVAGSRRFNGDLQDPKWLVEADGAKILKMVFASVSNHRVEFRKVLHTPQILAMRSFDQVEEVVVSLDERLKFLGVDI